MFNETLCFALKKRCCILISSASLNPNVEAPSLLPTPLLIKNQIFKKKSTIYTMTICGKTMNMVSARETIVFVMTL